MSSLAAREAYKDELTKLAADNGNIICLEADLGGKEHPFQQSYPDRFFNLGIAELASVDIAAGLSKAGFVPFFSTFASFAALRAAEGVKLALGYMGENIKIVAAYGGVSGGWFGTTHHCLEDIAVIQTFQNIRIACPHGEAETRRVVQEAAASKEPYYIRLSRNDKFDSLARDESSSCRELLFEGAVRSDAPLCLVSIGEQATEICSRIYQENERVNHAHLCYVDRDSLKRYKAELQAAAGTFLVVEEHRAAGGTASSLALLLPESQVYSHDCGEEWPIYGGSHADVLHYLGFGYEALTRQIAELGGDADDF
ncbi:transketolase [Paenibacillus sp. Leaf72]|uniref:transketolase n=1 Tax=Paenibacillus sp. Leaf72 TaxID=1736234 RepID=UPI0006FFC039|nr:transketolase [Paenibacillus sp. Leaf72]KQO04580.1 transketolase [Paenibacillus sp. Leaf72]